MSGRAGLLSVRICSLAVLLLAVMPNVLYVGHGGLLGGHSRVSNHSEEAEHAAHCHLGPKQCSSGLGSAEALSPDGRLVLAAGSLFALLWPAPAVKASGRPSPLRRPPRGTIPFHPA